MLWAAQPGSYCYYVRNRPDDAVGCTAGQFQIHVCTCASQTLSRQHAVCVPSVT
jgi:hypothetical protein